MLTKPPPRTAGTLQAVAQPADAVLRSERPEAQHPAGPGNARVRRPPAVRRDPYLHARPGRVSSATLAAKMLRVPVLMTYHTDFPAYVEKLTGDHRQAGNVAMFMRWFYKVPEAVFTRSASYRFNLTDLGVAEDRICPMKPGIDLDKFNPTKADPAVLRSLGVDVEQDAERAALCRPGQRREEPAAARSRVQAAFDAPEGRPPRRSPATGRTARGWKRNSPACPSPSPATATTPSSPPCTPPPRSSSSPAAPTRSARS